MRNRNGRLIQNVLQVIDTASGKVLQTVDNPYLAMCTMRECVSQMAISPDGRWLYAFRNRVTTDGVFNYLSTFDTVKGRFLPETASLAHCGVGTILVLPDGRRLNVLCYGTNDIRFLELTENGAALTMSKTADNREATPPRKIPLGQGLSGVNMHSRGVVLASLSVDGSRYTVVMGDGRFFKVDNQARTIMRVHNSHRYCQPDRGRYDLRHRNQPDSRYRRAVRTDVKLAPRLGPHDTPLDNHTPIWDNPEFQPSA